MTRISELERPYPESISEDFERIMGKGKEPLRLFTTLAASPRAWAKFLGGALLDGQLLSLREREIVINRTCMRSGCEYEWGVHVAIFAEKASLSAEDITALMAVPIEVRRWSAREATLIATTDALHERSTLSEAEFGALAAHFDRDQILEIIMLAGFYRTVSYLANGLDLEIEPGAARFAQFRDETRTFD